MKLHTLLMSGLFFMLLSCTGKNSEKFKSVTPSEFAAKINETPNAQILDVRTPEEYNSEHIENAANVNWNGSDFEKQASTFDKSKPVYVYCMSGGRSKKASDKLAEMGFKKIIELDKGFISWSAAGLNKPSDKIIGISLEEYDNLLNSDKKVLIDFYAEWCGPCKKMAPYLSKMEKELKDNVVIIRLDADKNKTMTSKLKIDALPTLLLYENKTVKWKHSGYISEEDLRKQL